ncbi:hypothetical protein Pmani_027292 [Petrolisthes manimaculis]|uniref:C2H2-type domain-containing protein n=2 Tax=Petrolisthes TaxID=84661 RepID=A0AAE1P3V3_9EUCA|nr:hypothetical protein Pcinc_026008 [Petrolisthes cinctipes]KAK4300509.1 hypothetical protein Pmani_027292 [Petrolisthes manimaculis]
MREKKEVSQSRRYPDAAVCPLQRGVATMLGNVCGLCGRSLSSTSSLERHLRYHRGERRHACPHCPYRAVARDKLVNHLHTHTGHRPHKCQYCPFATIQATHLRRHIRSKHPATLIQQP